MYILININKGTTSLYTHFEPTQLHVGFKMLVPSPPAYSRLFHQLGFVGRLIR
jgi:hypothetical protein